MALIELEKFLRKVRLLFSKIDRVWGWMIRHVRRVHLETSSQITQSEPEPVLEPEIKDVANVRVMPKQSAEQIQALLKEEEQRLIIEIAKDPKNPALYQELGDVYLTMKNFSDAKESFETALSFDPQNTALQEKLAHVREQAASAEGPKG